MKLSLLREFQILQPAISSGQDGVFSHLVLTHCKRIGMTEKASFHYTHAREGSTFATHLTRHDLIPEILEKHYRAIEQHYDQFGLWDKNAQRLLGFIADESLRNRLDPHLPHFNGEQTTKCFNLLSKVARKACEYLTNNEIENLTPPIKALTTLKGDRLIKVYQEEILGKKLSQSYPFNSNIINNQLIICKYANAKLTPSSKSSNFSDFLQAKVERAQAMASTDLDSLTLGKELRAINGKLDLAINAINNSTIQIATAIGTPTNDLQTGNPEIVVSLTTLPHRLSLVHLAIESIYSQTEVPSRIILWITKKIGAKPALTPQLESLVARGLEIRQVEDVGPHTKLIYALRDFRDKNIITVDDDIIYPINAISCLWEQHIRFPNAIICNWARELAFDSNGKVKGVRAGKLLTPPRLETEIEQAERFESKPNLLAFPYGTSGVLYPPNSLNEMVFDVETFRELCPKEDDIWFKAMALLNRTPVVVTNLGINPSHHCITGSQSEALRHDNHGQRQNELQMQRVFEYFNLGQILV